MQVLREAREQNKKAEARIVDLEQNLTEAHGDIKVWHPFCDESQIAKWRLIFAPFFLVSGIYLLLVALKDNQVSGLPRHAVKMSGIDNTSM